MKNTIHILLLLSSFVVLFSTCKNPSIDYDTFTIDKENITTYVHEVTASGTFNFTGEVTGMKFNIGLDEQLADAESHPMNIEGQSFSATVNELAAGTQYYYCFVIEFGDKHQLVTEVADFTTLKATPVVRTLEVMSTDNSKPQVKAIVDDDGGSAITERGVCWNLSGNPNFSDNHVTHFENSVGEYICQINGLEHNTTYYVRAYAKNEKGIGLGNVIPFTTGTLPTVVTSEVTDITAMTAICSGTVVAEGTSPVTERGICWSTEPNPTIEGTHANSGAGIGSYSMEIIDLNPDTTYYVRAYATNSAGTAYGDEVSFTTSQNITLPKVTTTQVTNITQNTATGSGNVTDDGGSEVTERGICWSINHNPTTIGSHANSGTGLGSYTVNMIGLTSNTTYYVRAYATNSVGTAYGSELSFTTSQVPNYTISVSVNPTNGGSVTGGGTYQQGQYCTVHAEANSNYTFTNWTENGNEVSTSTNYTFTVNENRSLVANFVDHSYTIAVSASPTNGGSVTGGGTYQQGQYCTVHAEANSNYTFTNWTENGSQVSTNANYTFTVTGNRTLVAHFAPTGAIKNGLFSVSPNQQVYFSQGNLQYKASNNTWRFATNQYDIIGTYNSNISSSYSGWIDLFGWGTSGWNCGNTFYCPWHSDINDCSSYGPLGNNNLTGSYANSDWGYYNSISNGGNTTHQWRTLTHDEWNYVFNTRSTPSGIRYAKARVDEVNGVILLPDNWSTSTFSLNHTNQSDASFSSNVILASEWGTLQDAGAVFLPAAGYRHGNGASSVFLVGSYGYYWSASYYNSDDAFSVYFNDGSLYFDTGHPRCFGRSVRLVCPAQ